MKKDGCATKTFPTVNFDEIWDMMLQGFLATNKMDSYVTFQVILEKSHATPTERLGMSHSWIKQVDNYPNQSSRCTQK